MFHRFLQITCCMLIPLASHSAARVTTPQTTLSDPGPVLLQENFSGGLDTNRWTIAKGEWTVRDGVLTGKELEADHHAAAIRTTIPFENAILQFDFRLDGCKGFSLSINEEKGHHSRVVINPDGLNLQKDRDKKDPRSLTLPLARQSCEFKPGVWYTLTVEYAGDILLARVDDRIFVLGRHEKMGSPKNSIGFTVQGASTSFDNILVRAAVLKADAAAVTEKLLARQAERPAAAVDPRTAYSDMETRLRHQLMQTDPAFNSLLDGRIAIEAEMQKRWPKAFRPGPAGLDAKRKLFTEDADFKAQNTRLAKARKAELDYLLKQNPSLAELRKAAFPPPPAK